MGGQRGAKAAVVSIHNNEDIRVVSVAFSSVRYWEQGLGPAQFFCAGACVPDTGGENYSITSINVSPRWASAGGNCASTKNRINQRVEPDGQSVVRHIVGQPLCLPVQGMGSP